MDKKQKTKTKKEEKKERRIKKKKEKQKKKQERKEQSKKDRRPLVVLLIFILVLLSILLYVFFVQKRQVEAIKNLYEKSISQLRQENDKLRTEKREIGKIINKYQKSFQDLKLSSKEILEFNTPKTQVAVLKADKMIGSFVIDSEMEARILEKIDDNLYVGVLPEKQGDIGYESFRDLYKINLSTGEVLLIRTNATVLPGEEDKIFINDISSNERYLAYVLGRTVYVEDLYEGRIIKEIQVPVEYFHIGGASFSPDNQKLAYCATSSYKKTPGAKAALFLVDLVNLDVDVQAKLATEEGGFFNITGWQNNNQPEYEVLNFNSGL
ncbi:MAG: hypothetical protein GF347_01165 [Candidatus Moranbacteria bacterium]|nr:hypothetical protein [Candidatus Moranbacteria bacterium]